MQVGDKVIIVLCDKIGTIVRKSNHQSFDYVVDVEGDLWYLKATELAIFYEPDPVDMRPAENGAEFEQYMLNLLAAQERRERSAERR